MNLLRRWTTAATVACCFIASPSNAETALEHQILTEAMPHEGAGGGTQVKTHWTSAPFQMASDDVNARILEDYRSAISECIRSAAERGVQIKPIKEWPDRMHTSRGDRYITEHYQITYIHSVGYTPNPVTCDFILKEKHTASLTSTAGKCEIDLDKKTANGVCDMELHRKAIALPAVRRFQQEQALAAAATPEEKAKAKAEPPVPTKNIAGLECKVFMPGHGIPEQFRVQACVSTEGSFHALDGGPRGKTYAIPLEETGGASRFRATRAALDASISESIFTPYLAGGFRITSAPGPRRR